MTERLICWDMDETLGCFRELEDHLAVRDVLKWNMPFGIRTGIPETLARLSQNGWRHVITTSAGSLYSDFVLSRSGLGRYFDKVYDQFVVRKNGHYWGKYYQMVLDDFGMTREEAAAKCVVVGDQYTDKPLDIPIVFIAEESGYCRPAWVIERVLNWLAHTKPDDMTAAFNILLETANHPQNYSSRKLMDLGDYVKFELCYLSAGKYDKEGERIIPCIDFIHAYELNQDVIRFDYDPEEWKAIARTIK